MWGWFGGGAQKRKDSPKDAILGLRSQLAMLQKRENYLQSQIDEQENLARKNVNSNKTGTWRQRCFFRKDDDLRGSFSGERGADNVTIAAKAALRRKKTHEHTMEQTIAQIGTLEQQINSIESANINRETLAAMEKAGDAMKVIHGKLTPGKVDETMYVLYTSQAMTWDFKVCKTDSVILGTNYGTRTLSARKSSKLLRATTLESLWTTMNWNRSWNNTNKSSWMSRCSRRALYLRQMPCTSCLPLLRPNVRATLTLPMIRAKTRC